MVTVVLKKEEKENYYLSEHIKLSLSKTVIDIIQISVYRL
jgi:hypothetical protein